MTEALPSFPFEPERLIGTVVEVTPSLAKVNLPLAAKLDGALHHGERRGGGDIGEFVVLDAGDNAVLARLGEIRLPERDRLTVEPKVGKRAQDVHPLGTVQLLASVPLDGSPVERGVKRFPQVGARAYSLDPRFVAWIVEHISEAQAEDSALLLELASIPGTAAARVRVTPERLFGRHCAVLGATGAGKSWSLARIVERVAEYKAKVILLDATGEYHELSRPTVKHISLGGEDRPAGTGQNSFPYRSLEERDLFALFQPAGRVQVPRLREAMRSLKLARILGDEHELVEEGCIPKANRAKAPFEKEYITHTEELRRPTADFDIDKLPAQIAHECVWPSGWGQRRGEHDDSVWGDPHEGDFSFCTTLIGRIESDLAADAFAPLFRSDHDSVLDTIDAFLADEETSILRVSLRHLSYDRSVREILANGLGRVLLTKGREERFKAAPLVLCVDEAHQFLNKELGDEFSRYPLDAFELVAKEGRKYSLSICLATQRPRDIPDAVIGQMGTLLVHRLTNDRDRRMVERAAGELDRSAAEFLPNLAPGQALLLGVEFPISLTIQVTPPDAKPDSSGPDFQQHWQRREAADGPEPPAKNRPAKRVKASAKPKQATIKPKVR
jgi:hypothetical protein